MAHVGRDDRGVSTALGYMLSLMVATLVVTGLFVAAGGFVEQQRDRAVRSEFRVVGQRVAADLLTTDRLARSAGDGHVRVESDVPRVVAGRQYTIRINATDHGSQVVLEMTDPDVVVRVPFRNQTAVATRNVTGGPLVFSYNESGGEVVVDSG